jgi:hypothetical protein
MGGEDKSKHGDDEEGWHGGDDEDDADSDGRGGSNSNVPRAQKLKAKGEYLSAFEVIAHCLLCLSYSYDIFLLGSS